MSEYNFTSATRDLALKENIENCKLEYQYSSSKGDGYLGSIQAVRLIGTNKTLDAVFKYSSSNADEHQKIPIRDAYMAEIYFYKTIILTFEKFQSEHHILKPFNNTPTFYASVETPLDELLVLENLKSHNYELWDRLLPMNRPHLELALSTFAKFHGTSMAMMRLKPDVFAELSNNINKYNTWWSCMAVSDFYNQIDGMITSMLDIFDPILEKRYRNKMEEFGKTVGSQVETALRIADPHDVIQQGDCWCNNAMYQYEDLNNREVPKDVKLLDFQMARKGPLASDLAYFFYTISSEECIDDLDYFMKLYHNAIGDHLRGFDLNVEEVFSYKTFQTQWQRCASFGLMLSINVCKMMLVEPEDSPDLINDLTTFMSTIRIDADKETAYRRRIKHIFMHFVDRKFI